MNDDSALRAFLQAVMACSDVERAALSYAELEAATGLTATAALAGPELAKTIARGAAVHYMLAALLVDESVPQLGCDWDGAFAALAGGGE